MQIAVETNDAGQRLDNFLVSRLKGVPKSRLYRIIRRGEVRVNGSRSKPATRLKSGDIVRIPPLRTAREPVAGAIPAALSDPGSLVIFSDRHMLVLNKPAGVAVHGGSGIPVGVIEALKRSHRFGSHLELAHRLDRETSGCLVLARGRDSLAALHRMFRREGADIVKRYTALLAGQWPGRRVRVEASLKRYRDDATGRTRVCVASDGQRAASVIESVRVFREATLVRITLETGRMHQARVHCRHLGHPILGDPIYGDFAANRKLQSFGLKRMFLHASELVFPHPVTGRVMTFIAPLAGELAAVLEKLEPLPDADRTT